MYSQLYGYDKISVDSEFGLSIDHKAENIPSSDSGGNPLTYTGSYSLYNEIEMNIILKDIPFDTLKKLSIPSDFTSSLSGRFIIRMKYVSSSNNITSDSYLLIFKNERNNYNA
jgi:hypothetical protein